MFSDIKNNKLQLYTMSDVASLMRVTPRTIYKHMQLGLIYGLKIGNQWRFTENHIQEYIDCLQKRTRLKEIAIDKIVEEDY